MNESETATKNSFFEKNDQNIEKYNVYQESSKVELELLQNYNYIFHVFYKNKNGINFDIFTKNVNEYKGKILTHYLPNMPEKMQGAYWIMKYGRYYYLSCENAMQPENMDNRTRYFVWKKLTLEQLMQYDNQAVGKVIKEYGIKID